MHCDLLAILTSSLLFGLLDRPLQRGGRHGRTPHIYNSPRAIDDDGGRIRKASSRQKLANLSSSEFRRIIVNRQVEGIGIAQVAQKLLGIECKRVFGVIRPVATCNACE